MREAWKQTIHLVMYKTVHFDPSLAEPDHFNEITVREISEQKNRGAK